MGLLEHLPSGAQNETMSLGKSLHPSESQSSQRYSGLYENKMRSSKALNTVLSTRKSSSKQWPIFVFLLEESK